ncbi:type IV pilus biogenesis protein PilM [Psychrobacillus psychrodurans]|uniref:type IV pilus biogenesis protein PilM n=1 Tax=Psychrobacillus psychrodurans TaxID=126157 RepID=UPI0008F2C93A|nr:pilus assembly protein PilM [Psychrobacillus psychrodurans]MCZ8542137.1 pilus assembly protein PilM [Psychrobacillus psychrodurans]SFN17484.1 type IV pilus assembly protein PilM [Psychrobacillus psychrodurans]
MFKKKTKRYVVLDLNEYLVRAIVMAGSDIEQAAVYEYPLNKDIFENDILVDEMALYETLKTIIELWGIKRYNVRFFVPDSTVMMKTFEHPSDVTSAKLKGYVEMELGQTIHLPFSQPLIDVYDLKPDDGEAVLFAAPSEEVNKIAGLLDDLHLNPTTADVRSLATIRFLEKTIGLEERLSYLIAEWSISGVSISIYTGGKVEFLRYQTIDTFKEKWQSKEENNETSFSYEGQMEEYQLQLIDQIAEIDRILNFYRFSLYKGEKAVDEIIILGDSPEMDYIASEMIANFVTPVKHIDDSQVQVYHPNLKSKHIPLIGLVYREA